MHAKCSFHSWHIHTQTHTQHTIFAVWSSVHQLIEWSNRICKTFHCTFLHGSTTVDAIVQITIVFLIVAKRDTAINYTSACLHPTKQNTKKIKQKQKTDRGQTSSWNVVCSNLEIHSLRSNDWFCRYIVWKWCVFETSELFVHQFDVCALCARSCSFVWHSRPGTFWDRWSHIHRDAHGCAHADSCTLGVEQSYARKTRKNRRERERERTKKNRPYNLC